MKEFTLPIMILTQGNLMVGSSPRLPSAETNPKSPIADTKSLKSPTADSKLSHADLQFSPADSKSATTSQRFFPPDSTEKGSCDQSSKPKCQMAFCDGTCNLHNIEHLFEPFIMVLMKCNKPTALYNVLLPVINR